MDFGPKKMWGGKLKASGLYYNIIRFILLQVTLRYVQDWRKARMVLSKIQGHKG